MLFVLSVFFMVSCGNKPQNTQSVIAPSSAQNAEKSTGQTAEHPGKKVYNSVCMVCHMTDGSGVPGMYPPIYESEFVNGDVTELIKIVLEGKSGKVEVKGETYNNIMPPQANLTDQQIADVLTFMRSNFGNNSSEITAEEVQKLRK